jgi:hypothetical protein
VEKGRRGLRGQGRHPCAWGTGSGTGWLNPPFIPAG